MRNRQKVKNHFCWPLFAKLRLWVCVTCLSSKHSQQDYHVDTPICNKWQFLSFFNVILQVDGSKRNLTQQNYDESVTLQPFTPYLPLRNEWSGRGGCCGDACLRCNRSQSHLPSSWPMPCLWTTPPTRGEPRIYLQGGGGRWPHVPHLPSAFDPAPGHPVWAHLLPRVFDKLPTGERLLPGGSHSADAADLPKVQPAGAQAAG